MAIIVFDLDGTLVESAAAIRDIANRWLGEEGLPPIALPEVRAYIGNGAPVFLERTLRARGAFDPGRFAGQLARYEHLYAAAPTAANEVFDGVEPALHALRDAGHRLALCTNKPGAPTKRLLADLGWEALITTVVHGDSLPQRKPAPEPLLHAIALAGGGRAVYVGDSEVDAATATAAGVPFLFFQGGYCRVPAGEIRHDGAFSAFDALADMVARHLGAAVGEAR